MAAEFSTAKVLICDDSMMIRKKMKSLLLNYGIEQIYEATNGREAVEKFVEVVPDITFMDIVMPEMTGVEALKMIKASAPTAKIIMATSIGTEGNLSEAIKYGANDFLQKPVEEEQLKKLLDNYFKEA
ncbi:MAG: response regulator [Ruminiclostridium sp.]|nr:response regulator [Ruminiclostridium sp.]